MKTQLTEDQEKKYEAIKWLTDPLGHRGSGRTQLLAMAYVEHSIEYNTWINVVNHGNSHPMAQRELINRIRGIVAGMKGYAISIKDQGNHASIKVRQSEEELQIGNPLTYEFK